LERNARKPDLLGYNFYPDFAYGWDERPDHRTNDFTKHGTIPLQKGAAAAAAYLTPGIIRAHRYFDLPVYLTETSAGQSVEARIAYIQALGDWATELRGQGIPLRGVNWWPLFDTIQWTYREDVAHPLRDFIFEGGWNNGLYRIQPTPDGDLKRVPTAAVQAFHDMVATHG
jgi:beta-glucosidase/6-phospho-beta-glucosidase/beta-galactosidase